MTNPNDLAFSQTRYNETPDAVNYPKTGLTKREYFAAMALQGICADQTYLRPNEAQEIATRAVELSDALITALNSQPPNQ